MTRTKNIRRKKQAGKAIDEFRTYKKTGHPAHAYRRIKNKYKASLFTHDEYIKETRIHTIHLHKNINPDDDEPSFVQPLPVIDTIDSFIQDKKYKNWRIAKEDKETLGKIEK